MLLCLLIFNIILVRDEFDGFTLQDGPDQRLIRHLHMKYTYKLLSS